MTIYGTPVNNTPDYFNSNYLPYGNVPGAGAVAGVGTAGYNGLVTTQWGNDVTALDPFGAPKYINAADGSDILPSIDKILANPTPQPTPNPTPDPTPQPVLKSSVINGNTYTGQTNTDIANQVNPTNDYSNYESQMDPTAYYNMIDQNYNEKQGLYNSNENALKAAQDAFNKTIETDYLANQGTVNTSRAKLTGQLNTSGVQAEQRKQDALNSAKQLYNQMQTGYRQRFGGASSAGEAAQTILGEEQQRQSGQIGRDYQNTAANIASQRIDLENQYNDSMLQLNQQKQKGLSDLKNQFVSQLAQINDNRAISVDAKNQAKLQVLQNMRNQSITIQSQHEQYAQQLEQMKMQQQLQIDTFNKTGGQTVNTANNAVNQFGTNTQNITSQLGQGNTTKTINTMQSQPQSINNAVGTINPSGMNTDTGKNWWEQ